MANNMMCSILEGLPDAIALQCLARVPFLDHQKLQLVCRTWKLALRSTELFKVCHELNSTEDLLCISAFDPENKWQLYDPLRDRWFTLPKIPSLVCRLSRFGVASVSGKLYVLGGGSDLVDLQTGDREGVFVSNEVWSFDLVTGLWTRKADMLVPRVMFACCALDDKKIVVAGGFTSHSRQTSKAEMYDPDTDTWSPLSDLCVKHTWSCSGVVVGGAMHVLYKGSSTVQILQESGGWEVVDYEWLDGPTAVVNGEPYVLNGGLIQKQPMGNIPVDSGISALEFMSREAFGMVGMKGELYIVGGVTSSGMNWGLNQRLSDVNVLALNGDWRQAAQMRCRGSVLGCTIVNI